MDSNKIVYVDIPAVATKNQNLYSDVIYGRASKTIFEILFEMNAIIDSENYTNIQDMLDNYPARYITLSLNGDNVKIPMVRFSITDAQQSYHDTWYTLLDLPLVGYYTIDRQSNDLSARYGICHDAPETCYIYATGYASTPPVE